MTTQAADHLARPISGTANQPERGDGCSIAIIVSPVVPLLDGHGQLRPTAISARLRHHLSSLYDLFLRNTRNLRCGAQLRFLLRQNPAFVVFEALGLHLFPM